MSAAFVLDAWAILAPLQHEERPLFGLGNSCKKPTTRCDQLKAENDWMNEARLLYLKDFFHNR